MKRLGFTMAVIVHASSWAMNFIYVLPAQRLFANTAQVKMKLRLFIADFA